MGNGVATSRSIFLSVNGKTESIVFSPHCSSQDIHDLICQVAQVKRSSQIVLKTSEGGHVPIVPDMPQNTTDSAYRVNVTKAGDSGDTEVQALSLVLSKVGEQAFRMEEFRTELDKRLNIIEKRLESESLKLVEIERCKKEISEVRDQVWQQGKKLSQASETGSKLVPMSSQDSEDIVLTADNGIKFVSMKRVPAFQKYILSQETVEYLKKPTFDNWHWEPNEMLSLLEHMYHELDLLQEFNMNPVTLKRWLLCIQANYRNNPFHNFRHCFCVSQMMYGMIHLCGLDSLLPKEDLGILITAAICHDLDHPGYNNTYQINARTELAIRYNDISPLENHHCAVAFQILNNPETNIFANVDKEAFQRIRKGMTMLILATDMARHAEILENFKKRTEEGFDFSKKDHLDTLKMVLIKCCDISNEVRPMEVSEPWVDCLLEEYFNQSDREKIEGLPVAPFMDREKVTKPTAQIGFIRFVLIPMFEAVAKLFPALSDSMVQQLKSSLHKYETLKEQEEARRKQARQPKGFETPFPRITEVMVTPLKSSLDHYEKLKQEQQQTAEEK
uniref:Phosphodiesterase n=1 Tax=Macrostomum lignano TaxID=282301 RepID=A0A1I8GZN0_9PLAT